MFFDVVKVLFYKKIKTNISSCVVRIVRYRCLFDNGTVISEYGAATAVRGEARGTRRKSLKPSATTSSDHASQLPTDVFPRTRYAPPVVLHGVVSAPLVHTPKRSDFPAAAAACGVTG